MDAPRDAVRPLLQMQREDGAFTAIAGVDEWRRKRAHLREVFAWCLGTPAAGLTPPPVAYFVLDEHEGEGYRRLKIEYAVEPYERVRAYLLIPHGLSGKAPGVLCLHGTAAEAKETQLGLPSAPGRDYGRHLAQRGFVCLCPDHLAAGERLDPRGEPYDTAPFYVRHPDWSAVGKAIWDGARALDILQSLEVVDGSRLGVAGHSLGGHGSLFLAAMDERVKAAVCNCGLTLFAENPKRLAWSRESWYRYFPRLRPLFLANTGLPFDLHEIAALIAPRAFLNISALADEGFAGNELLGEAGIELNKVWQLHGEGDRFGWFMFGGPHSVPHAARQLAAAWLEQWLQPGQ